MDQSKTSKYMLLLGMIIVILVLALLLGHDLMTLNLIKGLPIAIGVLLGLFLLLSVGQLLFSKQIIAKFAALPVMLAAGVIGYFLVKLPIYQLLISSMTGESYNIDSKVLFETMGSGFLVLQIGIWVSVIPIVIASIIITKKSAYKTPKNIHEYYPLKARIITKDYNNVRINKVAVYRLDLEIQHYEGPYRVTKDIRDVTYKVISFSEGDFIDVLVDPNKKKRVLIEIDGFYL